MTDEIDKEPTDYENFLYKLAYNEDGQAGVGRMHVLIESRAALKNKLSSREIALPKAQIDNASLEIFEWDDEEWLFKMHDLATIVKSKLMNGEKRIEIRIPGLLAMYAGDHMNSGVYDLDKYWRKLMCKILPEYIKDNVLMNTTVEMTIEEDQENPMYPFHYNFILSVADKIMPIH